MSGAFFACFYESLPVRQIQDRPESTGRFPDLLMHGMIREDTLEAQGKGLGVLLILEEANWRFLDGMYVRVCLPLSLSHWDFVPHNTAKYIMRVFIF